MSFDSLAGRAAAADTGANMPHPRHRLNRLRQRKTVTHIVIDLPTDHSSVIANKHQGARTCE